MTPAEALNELAAVGGPDAIARHLRDKRIVGIRRSVFACPVAHYLNRTLGGEWLPCIGNSRWSVMPPPGNDAQMAGETPAPIAEFLRAFDAGRYPYLIYPAEPRA